MYRAKGVSRSGRRVASSRKRAFCFLVDRIRVWPPARVVRRKRNINKRHRQKYVLRAGYWDIFKRSISLRTNALREWLLQLCHNFANDFKRFNEGYNTSI